ncbi:ShlB/FhaC/HecB family hemolysin secretion/activation protein [Nitrospinaceae bacterium]|nr:ShlB/FhaC/HecB family hemolysin secretion/activation protein [Nitrospinaceae bacterium]
MGVTFSLFFCGFIVLPSFAQITPQGRDQSYKQAFPLRFEERFKRRAQPKVQKVTVREDNLKPEFPAKLQKTKFILQKMVIKGSTLYSRDRFSKLFQKYMRKRISLGHVYEIAQTITNMYRHDGYILSKAVVGSQQADKGIIRIDIIEGFVGKVNIQGDVAGPRKLLNSYRKKLLNSKPLLAKDLERYLLLVDDLPGLSVKSVLTPSEVQLGANDLTLILASKKYDGSRGVDNGSSKFNGPIQVSGITNANSLLGLYEKIGFQAVVTKHIDELRFFNRFYEIPVSSEGAKIYFSTAGNKSQPGNDHEEIKVKGGSPNFMLKATHPFIRSKSKNLYANFSFIHRNSTTKFLGETDSEDKLRIANLGLSYDFVDDYRGVNLLSINWSQGFGFSGARGTDSPNLINREGTSGFTKFSGEVLRIQPLAASWILLGGVSWQYALDKLSASEQFGLGGSRFGRGSNFSEITGDHGVAFKLALQRVFEINKAYIKDIKAYTFFDYGTVWNRLKTSTDSSKQDLSSIGLGFRFNLTDRLSGYLELDKPLNEKFSAEGNQGSRMFFSLSTNF